MFRKLIYTIVFCLPFLNGYAQLPAKQQNQAALKKEVYGGFNLHSSGFGGTLSYSKFVTYKKKRLYTLDIISMKHGKEIKIKGNIDQSSKDFVYGKLNGLVITRIGIGTKKLAYEKLRENGINVSWSLSGGLSLGFLKPVYLDVVNVLPNGQLSTPIQEAYNPEKHHLNNIYGRSKGIRGLAETSVTPGGFVKFGIEFEYNDDREFIKAIETGVALDIFPRNLEIMAFANNTFYYPSVYLNLLIGRRYF